MPDQPTKSRSDSFALACTTLLFLPCMLLARLASNTRINNIVIHETTVSKRRLWRSALLHVPGNLILRFRRAPVQVLSTREWVRRSQRLANATILNNIVELKKLDGVPLCEFLANEKSTQRKLNVISTAMRSLFDFHLQHDESHGDASAANVMIHECPNNEVTATWFDFDIAHRASVPEVAARADDLRAILFTSKAWLTDTEFTRLFQEFDSCYQDEDVWKELIKTMGSPFQHCDIFHLAQQSRSKLRVVEDA